MMSDRDDQIITMRDELHAREEQLTVLQRALNEKQELNLKIEEELNFLRPKFSKLEEINEAQSDENEDLKNQIKLLKENLKEGIHEPRLDGPRYYFLKLRIGTFFLGAKDPWKMSDVSVRGSREIGTVGKWGSAGDLDRAADCKRKTIREFYKTG